MGEGQSGGLPRRAFAACVVGIVVVVLLQSIVHLVVVLRDHDLHSVLDLDRSNGLPDLVSTLVLGCAAAGAAAIAWSRDGARRGVAMCLSGVLAALTFADLWHEGAHPSSTVGLLVVGFVALAGALLVAIGLESTRRARATLILAACLLVASFLASGLDRFDQWFERRRGDPVAEYRIVAKEGLELLGWSLVALALWDEALRRDVRAAAGSRRRKGRG
jgi:hypothetical protein